jgi:glycosyltransferase involved in cell wall biosynthesis
LPRPSRILYVHHRPELGGAPVSLSGLISNLDRDRYEPVVYCPPGPAAELFARAGAEVITGRTATFTHVWASYYSGLRWLVFGRELSKLPQSVLEFRAALRGARFDLVHLNDSPLVFAGAQAHAKGLPIIWHLRSSLARGGLDGRSRAIARLVDKTAAAVIAIDTDVARSFPGETPVEVVHNSVDLEHFVPAEAAAAKRRLGIRGDLVSIGLFGYLYARKGWPDLLLAARRLIHAGAPVQFVIVGGGVRPSAFFKTAQGRTLQRFGLASDEELLARNAVREYGIEDRVRFLPFSSDPRDVYWALDIVTFPNRGEGLGRAVIEASACGRPIVASGSLDGAGLVRADETGFLVPKRSPDALAASLQQLVDNEDLRLQVGRAARAHAEANFDPRRNAAAVMSVYDEVLGR